ncbi:putative disease resistance protein RGA1 [Cinnamomum micranthum f. kanehirae]|uniref:Putative disease resistance protein RGA1 n=1 Tax=Cinnamomum micranthum f. kanehirae TaxID=337451 RepID=A0A443NMC1_9MAGN|nr:putative disease resistance protein RGA1 [Cinnamomum micranthum f. kanehirae]
MDSGTSMVAEAALGALFQRLFDTLALPFFKRLGFLFGVEKEAKKLKSTLLRIEELLSDAEERQIKEKSVRLWLSELKHIAYDAEDILDELAYMELQSKIEAAPIQTRKRKLTDQVPDFFSRLGSNFNLGSRIKEIRERFDELVTENNHLHLRVIRHGPETERLRMRPPTSSFVDESIVFGREADKAKVVRLLTSDDSSASDSSIHEVVPICGMGGLRKTTLAQLAYNDEHVVEHFEVRAWVYVSQDFDLIKLTKAIAESVLGRKPDLTNLDAIQVSIKEALKEKRFLLVLDDVWTEDFDDWQKLRAPLMFGARGSRILVTTRSQRVSSNMGTIPTHFLQGLSDDDCWSLFERRAFVNEDSDAHPNLVKIGKKIVNKCNGLPLAVKTLGGLLRSRVDVVEWEAFLKGEIWDLPEERNDILPALRLSYHHLPAHLKRCFAYCGCVVNKGWLGVEGNELILRWIAQGYIQPKGSTSEQMEDIGREYLANLVSRSLLNCLRVSSSHYTMHDLTHDLARSVLGADFWKIGDEKSHGNAEKARYTSDSLLKSCSNFEDLYCLKSLRNLSLSYYTGKIPADLFINLRHICTLRLCLYGNRITELPESIGDLLQLRYLDLSNSDIERLPKSTTRLYNLQTLILEGCSNLVELPSDLSNLVNLRHLPLNVFTQSTVSIPPRIGTLKGLQTLSHFNVGKEIGRGVNELKDLIHLRGYLCISELENVVNVEEAKVAQLKNKQKIEELELRWKCDDVESRQEGIEEEVLNALQPSTNLKRLEIEGYCGVRFPTWLGDSSFSNLTKVYLRKCRCRLLPPFGRLPSLKSLSLSHLYGLKKIGHEFYGDGIMTGFPPLEKLSFDSMPDLEELSGLESDIRHIRAIDISNCTRLGGLPSVSTIRQLTLSKCEEQIFTSLPYLTSVSFLIISNFSNLTSLGNGLQHLTSLQSLEIDCCPELTSLYDVDLPALDDGLGNSNYSNPTCLPKGLQTLRLRDCPKIPSLPEELLTTLRSLYIERCPLLVEKFLVLAEGGNGYRCKISDIPHITFEGYYKKKEIMKEKIILKLCLTNH